MRIGLCRQLSDDCLRVLASSCRRLAHLELQSSSITTAGVRVLAECCRNLKHLNLTACAQIDNGVFEPLSTLRLEFLSVAACKRLTVRACMLLAVQTLIQCLFGVGQDAAFVHIPTSLRTLILNNNTNLTDKALFAISERCTLLEVVELQVRGVLLSLHFFCLGLCALSLSGCRTCVTSPTLV